MDNLIKAYVEANFNTEVVNLFARAFNAFDDFNLPDYEIGYFNIIGMEDNISPEDLKDAFVNLTYDSIKTIFTAHLVYFSEEITFSEQVEILEGLFKLQNLSDYTAVMTELATSETDEEKFATILSQITILSMETILNLVTEIDPAFMSTLQTFVEEKEKALGHKLSSSVELQRKIVDALKTFKVFMESELKQKTAIGFTLVESNVILGQPLRSYLPFVKDGLVSANLEQLTLDIYSLILLTDEGYNDPLVTYRKYNHLLLDDPMSIARVDSLLLNLISKYHAYLDSKTVVENGEANG